jgi:hypothetical protein
MQELQFNQKDIEALTRKVATLEPYLSEQELALLLSIFAVASQRIERRNRAATLPAADTVHPAQGAVTGRQATFGDLQRQLLDAYVAGTDPAQGGFRASITGTPPTGVPPKGAAPMGIPTQEKNK